MCIDLTFVDAPQSFQQHKYLTQCQTTKSAWSCAKTLHIGSAPMPEFIESLLRELRQPRAVPFISANYSTPSDYR